MPTYKDPNYGRTPVADRAGEAIIKRYKWPISTTGNDGSGNSTALVNGDKILVGQLPAGHFLIPELCAGIADAANPGLTYSLCVDADANLVVSAQAVTAATYTKTAAAAGFPAKAELLGVSTLNRDVYFILTAVPTSSAGNLTAQIAFAPQLDKPVS